jgi:hypothetical protein
LSPSHHIFISLILDIIIGPQSKAQRYFESHLAVEVHAHENPADVIMDAIAEQGDAFAKQWLVTGHDYLTKMPDIAMTMHDTNGNSLVLQGLTDTKTNGNDVQPISRGGSIDEPQPLLPGKSTTAPSPSVLHPFAAGGVSQYQYQSTNHHQIAQTSSTTRIFVDSARNKNYQSNGTTGNGNESKHPPYSAHNNNRMVSETTRLRSGSQVAMVAREQRGAPFFTQFLLCHIRSLRQQHEKLSALVLESGVAMFAGLLMGVAAGGQDHQGVLIAPYTLLSPSPLSFLIPQLCMFINMSIGLAASSPGVKMFGEEKVVFWREAGAGHSRLAYFLGVITASFYRIILSALHFTMIYHILAMPLISFGNMLSMIILTFYAVYGLAAAISMVLAREDAPLLAVVASLFAAVFGGYVESLPDFIKKISYAFWASEAMFDQNVRPFRGIYQVDEIDAPLWNYTCKRYGPPPLYTLLCLCCNVITNIR